MKANFSCSVPARHCAFGFAPSANHATSSSRDSMGVRSTTSRAIYGFSEGGATLHMRRAQEQCGGLGASNYDRMKIKWRLLPAFSAHSPTRGSASASQIGMVLDAAH